MGVIRKKQMRKFYTLFFLISFGYSNAQIQILNELPFNITTLANQQTYSLEHISPKFVKGEFFYFNVITKNKEFENGFEEAYPFIGKSALIKENGKFGVIDLKGNYLVQPKYESYHLPPYNHDSNLVIFIDFGNEFIFDLNLGKENTSGYTICEEPAIPIHSPFKSSENKYGIKDLIEAKYDSILDIHFDYFVMKKEGKIGVIDKNEKEILPFEYTDYIFSRGDYFVSPQKIGLKKDKEWNYFEVNEIKGNAIVTSKIECFKMHNIFLKNALGIFKKKESFNILFTNGKKLKKNYNWISDNGLIGIKSKSVYLLNPDGTSTLYYD